MRVLQSKVYATKEWDEGIKKLIKYNESIEIA